MDGKQDTEGSGTTMSLTIWYVSAYDAPEGHSSRTYDHAMELTRLGHRVTMFTNSLDHFTKQERLDPGEKWREEWFGRVRVIWLKTFPYRGSGWRRGLNMLSNAWRAYWVGRSLRETPDVIFGPSVPLFTALSAYALSKKKKCPFCFEIRDIWPQALIDQGSLSERSPVTWLFRRVERFLYRRAAKIISVLPFAYRHICTQGIPRDRETWIPNGVRLERFSDCAPYDGGREGELTVMYVGAFSAAHGPGTILQAAKMLQEEGIEGVRFVLVGGGTERERHQELAKTLGLENLEFRGTVAKSDIPRVQQEADVLVVSVRDLPVYRFGINFNKMYDYLASGRPVLFAVNSPNDPVADADAGVSIPPEDPKAMAGAIKSLLAMTPEQRRCLGENAKRYAQAHYDTKKLVRQLESVLYDVTGKQPDASQPPESGLPEAA